MQKKSLVYQLTTAITTLMTVILLLVISITSVRTSRDIQTKIYASTLTLLDLQIKNVAAYFSQMDAFSLNPRNDVRFLKIVSTAWQSDYSTKDYLMTVVRNTYYQRDDLVDYSIYIVNQNKGYTISQANRNIKERPMSDITSDPFYKIFSQPKYYRAIISAEPEENLLVYYRTIINIENGRPLAFVRFTVNTSWFDKTLDSDLPGEITVLENKAGSIYYLITSDLMHEAALYLKRGPVRVQRKSRFVLLGKEPCLAVSAKSDNGEWNLTTFISKRQLDSYTEKTRTIMVFVGLLFIIAGVILLSLFIRVLTRPLSVLAEQLRIAGRGNFKTPVAITGCSETTSLSDEYNTMISRIDELIEKNYVVELNWKSAQLSALKSQINPHFLYNTLQTISAEAIENDQMKINEMVMALSSMLKYTIRGPDTVALLTELDHVNDYLFLQKARFEDRINYKFVTASGTENLLIPKISIITLVENSIIHGMSKTSDTVHIEITTEHINGKLVITVTDDGVGIPEPRLNEIQTILAGAGQLNQNKSKENECIGLLNLFRRLKLMYGETSRLCIYSTQYTGTSTVMEVDDV